MTSQEHSQQLAGVFQADVVPVGVLYVVSEVGTPFRSQDRQHTGTCNSPMWTSSALILRALSSISRTCVRISEFSKSASRTRTSKRLREFHVCPCTFAASDLIVGLAMATSSTVTIRRPGRDTKLKVSAGKDNKASRSFSWYSEFFHTLQNPVTA